MNETHHATARQLVAEGQLERSFTITYKQVFGAVAAYASGKIFLTAGRFGIALKLKPDMAGALLAEGAGGPLKYFDKGHVKKGYVVLFDAILCDPRRRSALLRAAARYAQD